MGRVSIMSPFSAPPVPPPRAHPATESRPPSRLHRGACSAASWTGRRGRPTPGSPARAHPSSPDVNRSSAEGCGRPPGGVRPRARPPRMALMTWSRVIGVPSDEHRTRSDRRCRYALNADARRHDVAQSKSGIVPPAAPSNGLPGTCSGLRPATARTRRSRGTPLSASGSATTWWCTAVDRVRSTRRPSSATCSAASERC